MICCRNGFFLFLLILCFHAPVYGQEDLKVFLHPDKFYKKYFPNLKIKRVPLDTNYIRVYPNYFTVGVHLLSPALTTTIAPKNSYTFGNLTDAKFKTSIADIIGFSANYRFVSIGFALLLKSGLQKHSDYAPSAYRTLTVKYNNAKYVMQFKYLRAKGFTDVVGFGNSSIYKRPDILNKEFQFEGIYNFDWKRYSYVAPLIFSQRQIKTRVGILLKGGFYYKKFGGDSSLIDKGKQLYYQNFDDTKAIQTFSVKLAPGVGGNFVMYKSVILSMAIFPSFDIYFYRYMNDAGAYSDKRRSAVFSIDGFVSLGYQSKRFYAGLRFEADRRDAALRGINMNIINAYTGLEVGYRFDVPHIIKKVYRKTMPPGM